MQSVWITLKLGNIFLEIKQKESEKNNTHTPKFTILYHTEKECGGGLWDENHLTQTFGQSFPCCPLIKYNGNFLERRGGRNSIVSEIYYYYLIT